MKKKQYEQPRIDVVNQTPWLMADDELFIDLSNPTKGDDDPRSKEFDFDDDEGHDWDTDALWKKSKWED